MSPAEIRAAVIDILETIAPDEDLSNLDDGKEFRDQMELDSMDFLDIVMELRKRYRVQVPEEDYEFWCVAFHDENGEDLFRKDADLNEINNLKAAAVNNNGWINLWREYTGPKPARWIVWPYSTSKEWCERIEGDLTVPV